MTKRCMYPNDSCYDCPDFLHCTDVDKKIEENITKFEDEPDDDEDDTEYY